jgi:hypothetical protein
VSRQDSNIGQPVAHLRITPNPAWAIFTTLLGCFVTTIASAQEPDAAFSPVGKHWIEIGAGSGAAIPASWYNASRNQSAGLNVTGSALVHLGWGVGVGIGVDWSRLPWTPNAGPSAHVDSWIVGPEVRYTDYHLGRVAPLAYLGLGLGGISQSRQSSCAENSGGPAARAGIGADVRLSRRWRVGVSAGVVLQPPSVAGRACDPAIALTDPGSPEAPGNIWGLRLEGGGDLL